MMNWRGLRRKLLLSVLRYYPNIPGGTEESQENLSPDGRFLDRDSNPVPPDFSAIFYIYFLD
jgi:hypothetical protein